MSWTRIWDVTTSNDTHIVIDCRIESGDDMLPPFNEPQLVLTQRVFPGDSLRAKRDSLSIPLRVLREFLAQHDSTTS